MPKTMTTSCRTMAGGGDCGFAFSELNIKTSKETKMQNEPCTLAFVSGSDERGLANLRCFK
ncbi:hypothetical protein ES703_98293 [subsurface metagenome]